MKLTNRTIILFSQFITSFGAGISNIALLTVITEWFTSANYIGCYSFFAIAPRILLSTYIGELVDSSKDLKRLLLLSMGWTAGIMVIIAWSVAIDFKHFWWLIFWVVLYEIAGSFYLPILTKILVILFTKQELSKLNAALTTAVTSASLFSGLVVALLLSSVSLNKFMFIDFSLYLVSFFMLQGLKFSYESPEESESAGSSPITSLWDGIKLVREFLGENQYIAPIFYVALLFNIALAPQSVYFAELARNVFIDLKLLGIFNTLFVGGFLLGSLCYRIVDMRIKIHQYILISLVLVPCSLLLLSLHEKMLIYLGIVLLGVAIPLYNISTRIILQTKIAKERVATISNSYYSLMNATQPLGLLGIPYLISLFGVTLSIFFIAMFLLLVASLMVIFKKVSSKLDIN